MRKLFYVTGALAFSAVIAVFLIKSSGTSDSNHSSTPKKNYKIDNISSTDSDEFSSLPIEFQEPGDGKADSVYGKPPLKFKSLRGSSIPDGLRTDENGNLVCDAEVRLLFDYFLMAQQDVDNTEFEQIVIRWIKDNTNEKAAETALDLWNRYRGYQEAIAGNTDAFLPDISAVKLNNAFLDRFETALEQRKMLQNKWLADVEKSWFEDDNEYDNETLIKLRDHLEAGENKADYQKKLSPAKQHVVNPEYEQQLAQLRKSSNLNNKERLEQEEELRQKYFPDRKDYIRQSLRDLSGNPEPSKNN